MRQTTVASTLRTREQFGMATQMTSKSVAVKTEAQQGRCQEFLREAREPGTEPDAQKITS
jgi:hypothetical protein